MLQNRPLQWPSYTPHQTPEKLHQTFAHFHRRQGTSGSLDAQWPWEKKKPGAFFLVDLNRFLFTPKRGKKGRTEPWAQVGPVARTRRSGGTASASELRQALRQLLRREVPQLQVQRLRGALGPVDAAYRGDPGGQGMRGGGGRWGLHLRFRPLEKIEEMCPVVKSSPFKTNRGKSKLFLNKWKRGERKVGRWGVQLKGSRPRKSGVVKPKATKMQPPFQGGENMYQVFGAC